MPDNKTAGWRKKISSKPKDLQPPKTSLDDATNAESGRHRGWRKTMQASRPATPTPATPATPTFDDTEIQSERQTCSTPRPDSKPKLTRYTSLFSGFKDTTKAFEFDTPWNDIQPSYEPYVDPKVAIQSIRSHMVHFSMTPIPVEYSNNLFCIFEHYHKLCEENRHLDMDLKRISQEFEHTEQTWAQEEQKYADEIRRLELLMSRGTSGVAGVLHARQGSMVDRKRLRRTATSNAKTSALSNSMTEDQITAEIKTRSQKVLLQRPGSPSSRMTALSRRLGRASTDLLSRTPLEQAQKKPTLSRKVQSELNLAHLSRVDTARSIANSIGSAFSGGSGDLLPDEVPSSQNLSELSIDCDAIIALRELGVLVARRRGLDVDTFVKGVMTLLSEDNESGSFSQALEVSRAERKPTNTRTYPPKSPSGDTTPKPALRRFQSQPQLNSDQKRRRHFSFEPGEDQLQALKEELITSEVPHSPSHLSPWTSSLPHESMVNSTPSTPNGLATPQDSSTQHSQSVSKIPSPLQAFGNVRRETSISSLRSTMARSIDCRHNSRSSVLTAYRDDQTNKLRQTSSSRSSSCTTSRGRRLSPSTRDRVRNIRGLSNGEGQSSEHTPHGGTSQGDSPGKGNTKSSNVDASSSEAVEEAGSTM